MKKCNAKLSPLVRCQKEIYFGTFGSLKPAPSGFGKGMGALSGVVGRVPHADATQLMAGGTRPTKPSLACATRSCINASSSALGNRRTPGVNVVAM